MWSDTMQFLIRFSQIAFMYQEKENKYANEPSLLLNVAMAIVNIFGEIICIPQRTYSKLPLKAFHYSMCFEVLFNLRILPNTGALMV